MAKYLEMSATVQLNSSGSVVEQSQSEAVVKDMVENGAVVGYNVVSPISHRTIFIPLENGFNKDYVCPTFEKTIYVPADGETEEEHFGVINGMAMILGNNENGNPEIVGCQKLPKIR